MTKFATNRTPAGSVHASYVEADDAALPTADPRTDADHERNTASTQRSSAELSINNARNRVLQSAVVSAEINLEGFNEQEERVMNQAREAVTEGLGALFHAGHNDILVQNARVSDAIANTVCYGKEALVEFDMEAHKDADGKIDEGCLPCCAQTLTHEIFLHAVEEFRMFHRKENPERRTAKDGHREACLEPGRQKYLEVSLRVLQALIKNQKITPKQCEIFLQRWHDEIVGLAKHESLALTEDEKKDAIAWAATEFANAKKTYL